MPFAISLVEKAQEVPIGICNAVGRRNDNDPKNALTINEGRATRGSQHFGIPAFLLNTLRERWQKGESGKLFLSISPAFDVSDRQSRLVGTAEIELSRGAFDTVTSKLKTRIDVTCRDTQNEAMVTADHKLSDSLGVRILATVEQIGVDFFTMDLSIEPRIVIENKLPITLSLRTPMPHVYSELRRDLCNEKESTHSLQPGERLEVFTPGPSIAVTMRCTDIPMGGTTTDWMDGWVDLPLMEAFRLPEPVKCILPFTRTTVDPLSRSGAWGTEFFITQGSASLADLHAWIGSDQSSNQEEAESHGVEVAQSSENSDWNTFFLSVLNYAVDHTGDLLFEQLGGSTQASLRRSSSDVTNSLRRSSISSQHLSRPFGAFGTRAHNGRISLLPSSFVPIRLLQLTMDGDEGLKRSAPFCVDDISICDGGVNSTPIKWEDGKHSGYFAYRNLLDLSFSEIHVVPEYVVFNGSTSRAVRVKQPGGNEVIVNPGAIAPLRTHHQETATVSIEFLDLGARTPPLRVDALGLRVAVVKSPDGFPIGSVALQTVVGAKDSRLVIKLGDIKHGVSDPQHHLASSFGSLENDFLRFRVQWSELRITLDEARRIEGKNQAFLESALDKITEAAYSETNKTATTEPLNKQTRKNTWVEAREHLTSDDTAGSRLSKSYAPICTLLFHRFTIDWQRVFKDDQGSKQNYTADALRSPERSQLSVIIHNVQVRDETPESPYPIVFDSSSSKVSFFDLCVRIRGPVDSDLVRVDLFDLNLAHLNGVSEKIVIQTSEKFVWKILDLVNQIVTAAGDFAGVAIELTWDEKHDGFAVAFKEKNVSYIEHGHYTPPKSDLLYQLGRLRVSPFSMLVSFKRDPLSSRYKKLRGVRGANIMNYFTRHLKFKIEKAELKFARYEARDVKGPPDRLLEELATVYFSRAKLKIVTILSAASFQDWKSLAARDGGDDEFLEGDILRATGNIAGNTASYVLRKAGRGLGDGVSNVSHALGETIESATGAIGARSVGAGVNRLVSGVGEGLGSTISGGECTFALLCCCHFHKEHASEIAAFSFFSGFRSWKSVQRRRPRCGPSFWGR